MTEALSQERLAKRKMLLDRVDAIAETLRASGAKNEELGTLAPEAVGALRDAGLFSMKLNTALGGAEVDPLTEMMVLETIAYHDFTSGWCTMVGATSVASMGSFLPPAGLDRVFAGGHIPTASISFYPGGRAVREGDGYRVNGRWRFNSGIKHAEWSIGGTLIEGSEAENGGRPIVIYAVFPKKDIKLHDNWGGVVGLRGTGSCDFSVENYYLRKEMTFAWDLLKPQPLRGGPSYLFPPFSYVAKEHGPVAIGAARRALDELITLATTTRGTFRASKLDERQVVHRFIGQTDLKIRAVRALLHERYAQLFEGIGAGKMPDAAAIADVRAAAVYATDIAIETATQVFHFAGNTGLHHPHVVGRLLRDLNTAGLHQVMSDTAYENHGKVRLGLPVDPMS
ncbi:MAG: acyl-CoA dehydrogenase family protein [Xanthobacteraceae bacterium]|nr:acyl-CoA dehydrogenase family protein [Xanthobacteraceae bacterium]